jgi:hypothetical protein
MRWQEVVGRRANGVASGLGGDTFLVSEAAKRAWRGQLVSGSLTLDHQSKRVGGAMVVKKLENSSVYMFELNEVVGKLRVCGARRVRRVLCTVSSVWDVAARSACRRHRIANI